MCIYPRCMMGGGSCYKMHECEAEDEKNYHDHLAQVKRNIDEQEAKTKLMKLQAEALEKNIADHDADKTSTD